jgi:hypothetical protein
MDDELAELYTDTRDQCLSDICTADCVRLDPGIQEKPPTVNSTSTIHWPWQGLPGSRSWAIWRRFLKTYTRDSASNRLRQTMGSWTQLNPTSGFGMHITTHPHKSFARKCLHRTKASWHYDPARITHARRFLAVLKNNTFICRRTSWNRWGTLLRCSFPPTSNSPY